MSSSLSVSITSSSDVSSSLNSCQTDSKSSNILLQDPVSIVFNLLERKGREDYIGEDISQIDHMIQSGMLARSMYNSLTFPHYNEFITANLLHDIGNLLDIPSMKFENENIGALNHEIEGSNYLRKLGFSELVCELVQNHVNAKRYLISRSKEYKLSAASEQTLTLQGGLMSTEEIKEFETSPHKQMFLNMREIDELAKRTDIISDSLESFRSICETCINKQYK